MLRMGDTGPDWYRKLVSPLIAAGDDYRMLKGMEKMWEYTGEKRPPFAGTPRPGQESVWDYPRPPKLVADKRRVVVRFAATTIADSVETYRVLETASPPTF